MIIRMEGPLANDHPDGPASCKPTLPYQSKVSQPTCLTKPTKPNRNCWLEQLTPGSVVPLAVFSQTAQLLIEKLAEVYGGT